VLALKRAIESVRISEELKHYVVALVGGTRAANGVQLGASPRASIALMKGAQALALFDGADFVTPEQIQELAVPVIAHRLVMETAGAVLGFDGAGRGGRRLEKIESAGIEHGHSHQTAKMVILDLHTDL